MDLHIPITKLAKQLGVHRNTAWRLVLAGEFPKAIKVGRDWRVPESDVAAYMRRNQLAPQRPINLPEVA